MHNSVFTYDDEKFFDYATGYNNSIMMEDIFTGQGMSYETSCSYFDSDGKLQNCDEAISDDT